MAVAVPVVHQVYVNVLNAIGTLRNPELLETWVKAVTVNTVRKELSRRKYWRRQQSASDKLEGQWARVNPSKALALRRFYALVEQMRPDVRVVFVLHVVEGYSLREIATLCKFSVPTAKRRLGAGKALFLKKAQKDPLVAAWMDQLNHER